MGLRKGGGRNEKGGSEKGVVWCSVGVPWRTTGGVVKGGGGKGGGGKERGGGGGWGGCTVKDNTTLV